MILKEQEEIILVGKNITKSRICDAAVELFSQKGYDLTSMDEIATVANVAKGTLYYHFKSKGAIFAYIVEAGIDVIYRETYAAMTDVEDPLEKIIRICRMQIETALENKELFRTILRELWGKEFRHESVRGSIKKHLTEMSEIIKEAQNKGSVKQGDSMLMAFNIFGAFASTGIYEVILDSELTKEQIIYSSINFILAGLKG